MSRDFTPRETYEVDRHFVSIGKESLRTAEIRLVDATGREIPLGSELSRSDAWQEQKKKYPELAFLMGDNTELIKTILAHDNERAGAYFAKIEETIVRVEQYYHDNVSKLPLRETDSFLITDEDFVFVEKWYLGMLDEGFYYHEENDRLFVENVHNGLMGDYHVFAKGELKKSIVADATKTLFDEKRNDYCYAFETDHDTGAICGISIQRVVDSDYGNAWEVAVLDYDEPVFAEFYPREETAQSLADAVDKLFDEQAMEVFIDAVASETYADEYYDFECSFLDSEEDLEPDFE